jgi:hypothetical protein
MFRGQKYTKPKAISFIGTLLTACLTFLGSQFSSVIGYWLGLLTMIILIIPLHTNSIWPTQVKKENTLIFSLFWGLILGTLLPFLITTFINEGFSGIYEIFTSQP